MHALEAGSSCDHFRKAVNLVGQSFEHVLQFPAFAQYYRDLGAKEQNQMRQMWRSDLMQDKITLQNMLLHCMRLNVIPAASVSRRTPKVVHTDKADVRRTSCRRRTTSAPICTERRAASPSKRPPFSPPGIAKRSNAGQLTAVSEAAAACSSPTGNPIATALTLKSPARGRTSKLLDVLNQMPQEGCQTRSHGSRGPVSSTQHAIPPPPGITRTTMDDRARMQPPRADATRNHAPTLLAPHGRIPSVREPVRSESARSPLHTPRSVDRSVCQRLTRASSNTVRESGTRAAHVPRRSGSAGSGDSARRLSSAFMQTEVPRRAHPAPPSRTALIPSRKPGVSVSVVIDKSVKRFELRTGFGSLAEVREAVLERYPSMPQRVFVFAGGATQADAVHLHNEEAYAEALCDASPEIIFTRAAVSMQGGFIPFLVLPATFSSLVTTLSRLLAPKCDQASLTNGSNAILAETGAGWARVDDDASFAALYLSDVGTQVIFRVVAVPAVVAVNVAGDRRHCKAIHCRTVDGLLFAIHESFGTLKEGLLYPLQVTVTDEVTGSPHTYEVTEDEEVAHFFRTYPHAIRSVTVVVWRLVDQNGSVQLLPPCSYEQLETIVPPGYMLRDDESEAYLTSSEDFEHLAPCPTISMQCAVQVVLSADAKISLACPPKTIADVLEAARAQHAESAKLLTPDAKPSVVVGEAVVGSDAELRKQIKRMQPTYFGVLPVRIAFRSAMVAIRVPTSLRHLLLFLMATLKDAEPSNTNLTEESTVIVAHLADGTAVPLRSNLALKRTLMQTGCECIRVIPCAALNEPVTLKSNTIPDGVSVVQLPWVYSEISQYAQQKGLHSDPSAVVRRVVVNSTWTAHDQASLESVLAVLPSREPVVIKCIYTAAPSPLSAFEDRTRRASVDGTTKKRKSPPPPPPRIDVEQLSSLSLPANSPNAAPVNGPATVERSRGSHPAAKSDESHALPKQRDIEIAGAIAEYLDACHEPVSTVPSGKQNILLASVPKPGIVLEAPSVNIARVSPQRRKPSNFERDELNVQLTANIAVASDRVDGMVSRTSSGNSENSVSGGHRFGRVNSMQSNPSSRSSHHRRAVGSTGRVSRTVSSLSIAEMEERWTASHEKVKRVIPKPATFVQLKGYVTTAFPQLTRGFIAYAVVNDDEVPVDSEPAVTMVKRSGAPVALRIYTCDVELDGTIVPLKRRPATFADFEKYLGKEFPMEVSRVTRIELGGHEIASEFDFQEAMRKLIEMNGLYGLLRFKCSSNDSHLSAPVPAPMRLDLGLHQTPPELTALLQQRLSDTLKQNAEWRDYYAGLAPNRQIAIKSGWGKDTSPGEYVYDTLYELYKVGVFTGGEPPMPLTRNQRRASVASFSRR